ASISRFACLTASWFTVYAGRCAFSPNRALVTCVARQFPAAVGVPNNIPALGGGPPSDLKARRSVRQGRQTPRFVVGRFTSRQRREAIAERFEVDGPEGYAERYNLAPAQRTLIVRERDHEREAAMVRWGLLPHWAKDERLAFKMINARAETLAE